MEAVAILSVCYLMNFMGVYVSTDPVSVSPAAQSAETALIKTHVAEGQKKTHRSLMDELMALNEAK